MAKNDKEYAKVYDRARRRAALRLREAYPARYEALLREEMHSEGYVLRRQDQRTGR